MGENVAEPKIIFKIVQSNALSVFTSEVNKAI